MANTADGRWVLITAVLGSSMAFIDATAVNVALPSIQADLHASASALQWTVEGYALFLSAFILIGGALGDLFGRRRIFCIGVATFASASLVCGVVQSIDALNIARAVQGIAAALATPGSLALISATFDERERGKAIGTWSGFAAITGAVGPLLGGWMAQYASWRGVFFINVPIAVFVVYTAFRYVPESRANEGSPQADYVGALLACCSLGGMTYALIGAQNSTHLTSQATVFGLAFIAFAAFIYWESRALHPMMPLVHFRNRNFAVLNIYTLLLYAALGGSLFFVPFNLQNVQGYSATAAGAAMLPFILILFATSRWSGGLSARIGLRTPLIVGACLAAAGFYLYSIAGIGGVYWTTFFPAACVLGAGGMLFVAPLTTGVMSALDGAHAGIASGINNAVSRIAGLIAIAALGLVLSANFYAAFDGKMRDAHISTQSATILRQERESLSAGQAPAALHGADKPAVAAGIRASYAAGFEAIMRFSALLSIAAAAVAAIGLPRKTKLSS